MSSEAFIGHGATGRAAAFKDFTVNISSVAVGEFGGNAPTVLQVCLPESVQIGLLKLKIKISVSRLTGRELEI